MTDIEAKKINEEVLDLINDYKLNDKKIAMIKSNDEFKSYPKEVIEILQLEIDQAYEYAEEYFLNNLLKLQEKLKHSEEHKDLLNNVNKLELIITKFWYKFYWKFKESPNDELFIKWKNAYLDCYKKPFEILWKVDKVNNKEVINNELLCNSSMKTWINSMDSLNPIMSNMNKRNIL